MSYLLFPGRHLVATRFQADYLRSLLSQPIQQITNVLPGASGLPPCPTQVIFALTSANQENSRFNPIPFHIRAMGIDRFARDLQNQVAFTYRVFGIPHYGHTRNFAEFTLKEIAHQSEGTVPLTPANCLVLCSTPEVIQLYQQLGFAIATAERDLPAPSPATPIQIIREIGAQTGAWSAGPHTQAQLAPSHAGLFHDFPEIPRRIQRLYQDPLTNQEGSLTAGRNYSTYARGMNEIIRLKYQAIRAAIRPGRIVDEGCADGALLAEVSQDFPDSDLYGIDLSAEFGCRFQERQRAGEFGGAYVHFFHRNLFDRILDADSIDTTLCNSTLHEIWSYGEGDRSVRHYLAEKFRQLRPGGRLLIRDVVGPEQPDQEVLLECSATDGTNPSPTELAALGRDQATLNQLSTHARFQLFSRDFRPGRSKFHFQEMPAPDRPTYKLSLQNAAEFLSKKDYTDNWTSELNEAICFWSFSRWKAELAQAGFMVVENPNQPAAHSRFYTNPWIVEHRYQNHVRLTDLTGAPLPWPPTNQVLIAEKPFAANPK